MRNQLFLTLWPILVYYPVTHWIRGGGWLSTTLKVLDFAGGLTLHTTAGEKSELMTIMMLNTNFFPFLTK